MPPKKTMEGMKEGTWRKFIKFLGQFTWTEITILVGSLSALWGSIFGVGYKWGLHEQEKQVQILKGEVKLWRLVHKTTLTYIASHFDSEDEANAFLKKYSDDIEEIFGESHTHRLGLILPHIISAGWGLDPRKHGKSWEEYKQAQKALLRHIERLKRQEYAQEVQGPLNKPNIRYLRIMDRTIQVPVYEPLSVPSISSVTSTTSTTGLVPSILPTPSPIPSP